MVQIKIQNKKVICNNNDLFNPNFALIQFILRGLRTNIKKSGLAETEQSDPAQLIFVLMEIEKD